MAKNKLSLDFPQLLELAEKFDRLGGDLKKVVQETLEKSKDLINERLHEQMKKHNKTGKTERSIRDSARVEWSGTMAEIDVGFDIAHGGLPSIFLMYGTPRAAKDQKLYNAVYGAATKRKVKQLQQDIFSRAIKDIMGG